LDKYTVTCLGQVLSTIDDNGSYRLKTNYSNEDFVDGLDSSHEYLTSGDKEIVLTLLQDEEVVSKVKTIVNIPVQYMSPDANFIFLYDESYKAVGFDAEMSLKQDRSIKKYIWDFGDGNIVESSDKRITHSFSESKTYLVKLTVVDVLENTSSKVREVYVPTFSVVAPDHSIAKETLLGIDSNTNLIRDDVERAIEILSKGNLTVKRNLLYIAHNFETGYRKSDIEAELNLLMRKTIDSLACLNKELNDERKVETLYSYLVLFYKNTPERSLIYYRLAESVNGESFQTRLSDEDLESFCLGVKNGN
jgi:hypothetical protein